MPRKILLLADLTRRIRRNENNNVVGRYGKEMINDSGRRIIDMCEPNQFELNYLKWTFST